MCALERLSLDEIAADDLLAAHHVHRYELAAALVAGRSVVDLCCGAGYGSFILARTARTVVGVDSDEAAIAEARGAPQPSGVEFQVADALRYLLSVEPGSAEAIVCFEGIEHVPDPVQLAHALAEHARAGTRIVLSFPNSRAFKERNPFHVTDFGYEETLELLSVFDAPVVLSQYLAEGSLLVGLDAPSQSEVLQGRVSNLERAEPEWANHYIAVVGAPPDEVEESVARLRIATSPNYNSYLRALEESNRRLSRANAAMGRAWLGVHDAAAASVLARSHGRLDELTQALAVAETRAERAERSAWENDQWLQEERRRNLRLRHIADWSRVVRGLLSRP